MNSWKFIHIPLFYLFEIWDGLYFAPSIYQKEPMNLSKLIFSVFVLIGYNSFAGGKEPTESGPTNLSTGYSTEVEAARTAIQLIFKKAGRIEYGGCIFILNGIYHFTEPVTSKSNDRVVLKCKKTNDSRFTAIYHTHPYQSVFGFSEGDIKTAEKTSLVSYVGDVESGLLLRYIHGKDRIRKVREATQNYIIAPGTSMGRVFQ